MGIVVASTGSISTSATLLCAMTLCYLMYGGAGVGGTAIPASVVVRPAAGAVAGASPL